MSLRRFLPVLLLLSAQSLHAAVGYVFPEPPQPRAGDQVEIAFGGSWPAVGVPRAPVVTVAGTTITIDLHAESPGPISVVDEWGERVSLGRLDAGSYTLVFRVNGQEQHRETLVVADAPFRIAPSFGTEGTEVLIEGALSASACTADPCVAVKFGNVAATAVSITNDAGIVAVVPAGASGLVDVSVTVSGGPTLVYEDGFRYANGFEGDYERVLFPVNFTGRGAHGSEWHSDIVVRNDGPVTVETVPLFWADPAIPVIPIPEPIRAGGRGQFPERETDGGAFLHVPRGLERHLSYSLHAVDRSRSDVDLGTEIPVVHAEDTAPLIRIVNVPLDGRFRATLRVYDFDLRNGRRVSITAHKADGTTHTLNTTLVGVPVCPVAPCFADRPASSVIDLSAVEGLRDAGRVDLFLSAEENDARIWGFVSVTNNETQHVTAFSPQHDTGVR